MHSTRDVTPDTCFLVCFEVDRDLRLDLYWRAIEVVGLVSPLADGFDSGLCQNGVPTEDFRINDVAVFGNRGFDLYLALGMNREGCLRIPRGYTFDQKSLRDALGNS